MHPNYLAAVIETLCLHAQHAVHAFPEVSLPSRLWQPRIHETTLILRYLPRGNPDIRTFLSKDVCPMDA